MKPARLPEGLTHPIYRQLLTLLIDQRFATTWQLARLTAPSYTTMNSARRQTSRHLHTLAGCDLVTRLQRRVGGWQGGSTQTIWAPTTRACHRLTGHPARQRPQAISTTFLDHLLAITEVRTALAETLQPQPETALAVQPEPGCWRRYLGPQGEQLILRPDLYVRITTEVYEDRYFMEVDRATENPARVLATCRRYQHYRRTGVEQQATGMFPAVVWIVPATARCRQLHRLIQHDHRLDHDLFIITTLAGLPGLIRNGPPQISQNEPPKNNNQ